MKNIQRSSSKQSQSLRNKCGNGKEVDASNNQSRTISPYRLRDFQIILQRLPPDTVNSQNYEGDANLKVRKSSESISAYMPQMTQPSLRDFNKFPGRKTVSKNTAMPSINSNKSSSSKKPALRKALGGNTNSLGADTSNKNVLHKSRNLKQGKTAALRSNTEELLLSTDASQSFEDKNNKEPSSSFRTSRNSLRKPRGHSSVPEQKQTKTKKGFNLKKENPDLKSLCTDEKKAPASLKNQKTISNTHTNPGNGVSSSAKISINDDIKRAGKKVPLDKESNISQKQNNSTTKPKTLSKKRNPKKNMSTSRKRKNISSALKSSDSCVPKDVLETNTNTTLSSSKAQTSSGSSIKSGTASINYKASKQDTPFFPVTLEAEESSSEIRRQTGKTLVKITLTPRLKKKKISVNSTVSDTCDVNQKPKCGSQSIQSKKSNLRSGSTTENRKKSSPPLIPRREISKNQRGRKIAPKSRKRIDYKPGNGRVVKSSKHLIYNDIEVTNKKTSSSRSSSVMQVRSNRSPNENVQTKKGKKPNVNSLSLHTSQLPKPQTENLENQSSRAEKESRVSEKNINGPVSKKKNVSEVKAIVQRGKKLSRESGSTFEILNALRSKRSKTLSGTVNNKKGQFMSENNRIKNNNYSTVMKRKRPSKKRATRVQPKERLQIVASSSVIGSESSTEKMEVEECPPLLTIDANVSKAEMRDATNFSFVKDEQLLQSSKELSSSSKNCVKDNKPKQLVQTRSLKKRLDHTHEINKEAGNVPISENNSNEDIDASNITKDSDEPSQDITSLNHFENEKKFTAEHETRKFENSELFSPKDKTSDNLTSPDSNSAVFENNENHQNTQETSTVSKNNFQQSSPSTHCRPNNDSAKFMQPGATFSLDKVSVHEIITCDEKSNSPEPSSVNRSNQPDRKQFSSSEFQNELYNVTLTPLNTIKDNSQDTIVKDPTNLSSISPLPLQILSNSSSKTGNVCNNQDSSFLFNESSKCTSKTLESKDITMNETNFKVKDPLNEKNSFTVSKEFNNLTMESNLIEDKEQGENSKQNVLHEEIGISDVFVSAFNDKTNSSSQSKEDCSLRASEITDLSSAKLETIEIKENEPYGNGEDTKNKTFSVNSTESNRSFLPVLRTGLNEIQVQLESNSREKTLSDQGAPKIFDTFALSHHPDNNSSFETVDNQRKEKLTSLLSQSATLSVSEIDSKETIDKAEDSQNKIISLEGFSSSMHDETNKINLPCESKHVGEDLLNRRNLQKEELLLLSSPTNHQLSSTLESEKKTATKETSNNEEQYSQRTLVTPSEEINMSAPTIQVNLREDSLLGKDAQIRDGPPDSKNLQRKDSHLSLGVTPSLFSSEMIVEKEKSLSKTVAVEDLKIEQSSFIDSKDLVPAKKVNLKENNFSDENEHIGHNLSKAANQQEKAESSTKPISSKIESNEETSSNKTSDLKEMQSPITSSKKSTFLELSSEQSNLNKDKLDKKDNISQSSVMKEKIDLSPSRFDLSEIMSKALKSNKLASMPAEKAAFARYLLRELSSKQSETKKYEIKSKYRLDPSIKFKESKANARPDLNTNCSEEKISGKVSDKPENVSDMTTVTQGKNRPEGYTFKVPNKAAPRAKKKCIPCSKSNNFLKPKINGPYVQVHRITQNDKGQTKCTKCYLTVVIPGNMYTGLIVCHAHRNVRKILLSKFPTKQPSQKNLPPSFTKTLKEKTQTPALKEKGVSLFDSNLHDDKKSKGLCNKGLQISEFGDNSTSNRYIVTEASIAALEDHRYFRTPPPPSVVRKELVQCKIPEVKGEKVPSASNALEHNQTLIPKEKMCIKGLTNKPGISYVGSSESHSQSNQKSISPESENCCCSLNNPSGSKAISDAVFASFAMNRCENIGKLSQVISHSPDTNLMGKCITHKETSFSVNNSENSIPKMNVKNESSGVKNVTEGKLKGTKINTVPNNKPNDFKKKESMNNHSDVVNINLKVNNGSEKPRSDEIHSLKLRTLNESRTKNSSDPIQSKISDIMSHRKNCKSCSLRCNKQDPAKPEFKTASVVNGSKRHLSDPLIVEKSCFPKRFKIDEDPDNRHYSQKCFPNDKSSMKINTSKMSILRNSESTPPEKICMDNSGMHVLHTSETINLESNSTSFSTTKLESPKKVNSSSAGSFRLDITKQNISVHSSPQKHSVPPSDEQNKASKKIRSNENFGSNIIADTVLQNHAIDSKQYQKIDCSNIKIDQSYLLKLKPSNQKGPNKSPESMACNPSKPNFSDSFPPLSGKNTLVSCQISTPSPKHSTSDIENSTTNTSDEEASSSPPSPESEEISDDKSQLAAQICEFVSELSKLDNTTAEAINKFKRSVNNEKVNQELRAMIPREELIRTTHPDRPPEWFLKFVANFRKHELWRLHQMFKIHDHLMRVESAKINVLEKVYEELKENERLRNQNS